ncbi:leucyl aminopeptidase [Rickettsiales endosymbiont of Peranema trichophorum]|uniref:leucyl aminopeptidase n=1 Tax=Rickettsiales endosymbiont of Peranema trichophorum TaxID=2486577 RepID=UPI00102350AB|nr:leucyl aminopeptidase [Rickettsiales endosymbiont of Peranema trichophorum]RZI45635.1 leucyl aminopeptidase [Rickettsiales endosymbiont of Peranema trichophorum]
MKIHFQSIGQLDHSGDKVKICLVTDKLALPQSVASIYGGDILTKFVKIDQSFNGKVGQIGMIMPGAQNLSGIIVVGIGDPRKLTKQECLNIGGKITTYLNKLKLSDSDLIIEPVDGMDDVMLAAQLCVGMRLNNYTFNKYFVDKKDKHQLTLQKVTVYTNSAEKVSQTFKSEDHVIDGCMLARDLVSEPPNVIYPESLAMRCKELDKMGLKVTVIDETEMKKLGMNALLGVGQGSVKESKMVIMEWNGDASSDQKLAFVGKGVTFDTGGINLKINASISDMKYDMAGAATVIGLMYALAARNAKVNVIGAVGLVENMPSGSAQRPSDVVTSMSGQTIEVDNTDAEGRLVLADVLCYVERQYSPELIVDVATLTGAIVVALGDGGHAGLFSNDDLLSEQIFKAGQDTGELVWRMPMSDHYDRQIDSQIADVRNTAISSTLGGSSITAAHFLKRFVRKSKWAHLDIAGMAWNKRHVDYIPKGASGFGVRLLNKLILDNYE